MSVIKRIDMALHIMELCATNNIQVQYQSLEDETPRYWARPSERKIQIRPTKNTGYYVSALHELGHILGERQMQRNRRLTRVAGSAYNEHGSVETCTECLLEPTTPTTRYKALFCYNPLYQ